MITASPRVANGAWWCRRVAAIVGGIAICLAGASGAAAQGMLTSAPPVRSTVDANGVDLVTGALTITTPGLSIGQGEGALVYQRNLIATGWTDNVIGTIANPTGVTGCATSGTVTVSFGGNSENFTYSGGAFVNAQGGGSTLTCSSGAGTYTYTSASGVVVVYQQSLAGHIPSYGTGGRPISATYPDGRVITYTYNSVTVSGVSASRVQSVNNNFGYQLKFTYVLDTPSVASDLVNWTTIATVTGINNAVDYCSPTANSCSGFTQSWPTLTYATAVGPPLTVSVSDPLGNVTQYSYNENSTPLLIGITRPGGSGYTTAVTYDTSNRVIGISNSAKVVGPAGHGPGQWGYSYSTSGGNETVVAVDPNYNTRTVISTVSTSLPSSDTDGLGRTTSYLYDSYGRLTRVTQPETNYVVYAYDARGNVTTTTVYPNSGSGSLQASASFDTTCVYPAKCNQPNSTTDANSKTTYYTYDSTHGFVLTVTGPSPTMGAVAPQITYIYNTSAPQYAYYKNSAGNIVAAPSPLYLLTGTSSCASLASCTGTSDQVVSAIAYGYGAPGVANNLGVTSVSSGSGTVAVMTSSSQTYDVFGNVATTVGPLGSTQTTAYFWDADRQPAGVIGPEPAGSSTYPALRYTFSANGQPTLVEQGTTTSQASLSSFSSLLQQAIGYDTLGRQAQTSVASGGTTQTLVQYTYDNANRLTCTATRMNPSVFASPPVSACIQGALGSNGPDRITLNSYDAANELTQVTTGYLTTNQINYATLTYTANGFAKTVLDGANNLTTVVYDNYDRPYQVQFPMPTAGSDASNTSDYEQYGYDNNSNLTSKRLRSGDTVTFAYDALNRPTSETFPSGKSQNVYWGYDLLNRQLYANYGSPTGTGVSWTYDALGRIVTATNSGKTLSYQYDAASNRTRMTWPDTGANALYVAYVYDVLNRVTQIEENGATSGPGLLASYSYDSLGRRSSVARAGGSGAATGYTYDGASRLHTLAQTLAGSASVTYTLGYNAANQIVTKAVSNSAYVANPASITAGYTANGLNQYTAVTGITASYVAANSATLSYDATGALQTETTAGATTTFLYDGTNLVGEYSSAGAILNRYVPGPGVDEPVLWYQGSGTSTRSWLTADNQGSVIGYADQSGNSGATYTYGPYGEPITSSGASAWGGSRYRFTGQIEIPEAQLYYYKARVYDPAMGRFYQTDPVGMQSDVNLYAYATNDPVNLSDSNGNDYTVPLPGGGTRYCSSVDDVAYDPDFDDGSGQYGFEDGPVGNCYDVGGGGGFDSLGGGVSGGSSSSDGGTKVAELVVTARRLPQNTPPPQYLLACRNSNSLAAKVADFASNASTVLSGVATVSALGAAVTSETGVGLVGFGTVAGLAEGGSLIASGISVGANLIAGRPGNAVVSAVGTAAGFGLASAVARASDAAAIAAVSRTSMLYRAGTNAQGTAYSALFSCP